MGWFDRFRRPRSAAAPAAVEHLPRREAPAPEPEPERAVTDASPGVNGAGSVVQPPVAAGLGSRPPGFDRSITMATELPVDRAGRVVAVVNQKGGVGKTTSTVSIAAAMALQGLQVLVIDLDPQGNATTGLGRRVMQGGDSIYRVLVDDLPFEDATEPTAVKGLHVMPSTVDLAGAEIELVTVFGREDRLRTALADARDLYDLVIIDCPPSLGLLTVNALTAADGILVPIQCEYFALEGLSQLLQTVELIRGRLNPELAVAGIVMTMYDPTITLAGDVVDEVRTHFGDLVLDTVVPRVVRLSEAPSHGQPIGVFDPNSRGARAYARVAQELVARLGLPPVTDQSTSLLSTVRAGRELERA